MATPSIYDDLKGADLGEKVLKLEERNENLLNHIQTLENDIAKLCKELTLMKATESNLKRNISELFNTAKVEVQRKDRMIAELRTQLDDLLFRRGSRHVYNSIKRSREDVLFESDTLKRQKFESSANVDESHKHSTKPELVKQKESTQKSTTHRHNGNRQYSRSPVRKESGCGRSRYRQEEAERNHYKNKRRDRSRDLGRTRSRERDRIPHKSKNNSKLPDKHKEKSAGGGSSINTKDSKLMKKETLDERVSKSGEQISDKNISVRHGDNPTNDELKARGENIKLETLNHENPGKGSDEHRFTKIETEHENYAILPPHLNGVKTEVKKETSAHKAKEFKINAIAKKIKPESEHKFMDNNLQNYKHERVSIKSDNKRRNDVENAVNATNKIKQEINDILKTEDAQLKETLPNCSKIGTSASPAENINLNSNTIVKEEINNSINSVLKVEETQMNTTLPNHKATESQTEINLVRNNNEQHPKTSQINLNAEVQKLEPNQILVKEEQYGDIQVCNITNRDSMQARKRRRCVIKIVN